jgi:hypothetical protein
MKPHKIIGAALLLLGVFTSVGGWSHTGFTVLSMATQGGSCLITVLDEEAQPLEGVDIMILGVDIAGYYYDLNMPDGSTDVRGEASFAISSDGLFKLRAGKEGYASEVQDVPIADGNTAYVTFIMGVAPEIEGDWEINGEAVSEDSLIEISEGEEVTFTFKEASGDVTDVSVELGEEVVNLLENGYDNWVGSTKLSKGEYQATLKAESPHDIHVTHVTIKVKNDLVNLFTGIAISALGTILLVDPERLTDYLA